MRRTTHKQCQRQKPERSHLRELKKQLPGLLCDTNFVSLRLGLLAMPPPTQQALIYILLLWTTILSLSQVAWIALYFSAAGQSSTRRMNDASHDLMWLKRNHSSLLEEPPQSGEGRMLTYTAVRAGKAIHWIARQSNTDLLSESGDTLAIMKDGYYFLSLQVTLSSCEAARQETVSLKHGNQVLLQGRVHADTCSTGVLGKAEELSAGEEMLEVTINPPRVNVNFTDAVTHLDVIYMFKS